MITLHEINVAATALERDLKSFRAYLTVLERAEPRLSDAELEASKAEALVTVDGFLDRMQGLRQAAEDLQRQRPIVEVPPEEPEPEPEPEPTDPDPPTEPEPLAEGGEAVRG